MRTRMVIVLVSAATIFAAAQSEAGEVLDRINNSGIVRITHRDASIPFSYLNDAKQPIGFAVDACMRVAEAIRNRLKRPDLKVEFYPVTSANRIPAIIEGKADLECGSTTSNEERSKLVSFTIPYFIASARMVAKVDSGIRNWSDLHGKTIVTTKGTTNAKSIQERSDVRSLNIVLIEARDHAESFRMVESGKADVFAMDDILLYGLRALSAKPAAYVIVGDPLTVEPYAIMFSKDDQELKAIVDAELAGMIYSGAFHKLYQKWFQRPIPPKGANLEIPMGHLLRQSLMFPSDKVSNVKAP